MMPSPEPGASHGRYPAPIAHLRCPCQRWRPEPVALCGTPVERRVDGHLSDPPAFEVTPGLHTCVVCLDLARTALVARRCQRCAR